MTADAARPRRPLLTDTSGAVEAIVKTSAELRSILAQRPLAAHEAGRALGLAQWASEVAARQAVDITAMHRYASALEVLLDAPVPAAEPVEEPVEEVAPAGYQVSVTVEVSHELVDELVRDMVRERVDAITAEIAGNVARHLRETARLAVEGLA